MKKILTLFTLVMLTFTLLPIDAEAKRLGSSKSVGKQRDSINQQATPKPAQSQSAAPASAPAASGSKWGGALAGLAAGGLLAALFMGGAFDGINMADILMLVVLMAVIFFIVRMLRKPKSDQLNRPMQYSAAGATQTHQVFTGSSPATSASATHMADDRNNTINSIPPDFQVEPFLKNAKLSFINLQVANGAGDVEAIREYTTPELFEELHKQIKENSAQPQKTEVIFINADLLDVTTTNEMAIASVRFNGQLRESPDALPEPFDEIWHVQKDLREKNASWLLAGIQQPD